MSTPRHFVDHFGIVSLHAALRRSVISRSPRFAAARLALVLALWLLAAPAWARIDGIASSSCGGCHSTSAATVTLSVPSVSIDPGEQITLTVTIEGSNTQGGGFYISSGAEGTFEVIAGQGTKMNGSGVSHSARKNDVGGVVTFMVNWTAPDVAGVTRFTAAGVSANADGSRSGDQTGQDTIDIVYGCSPVTVYRDYDQDGYGTDLWTSIDCAASAQWAAENGDCNESNAMINPGETEVCNLIDDDCDTEVDEGLQNITVYLDEDGDGHGVPDQTALGCGANPGYASVDDDCDDTDELAYPDAPELCNERDDNCDGSDDEGLLVSCGVGICQRSAESCFASECIPGVPEPEQCNGLDDDCDVYVDDGEGLCPAGQICLNAQCVIDTNSMPDAGMSSVDGGMVSMDTPDASVPDMGGAGGAAEPDPNEPELGAGTGGVAGETGEGGTAGDEQAGAGTGGGGAGGIAPGDVGSSGGGCRFARGSAGVPRQIWLLLVALLIGIRRRGASCR